VFNPIPDLEDERFENLTSLEYRLQQRKLLKELERERDPKKYDAEVWWRSHETTE
jgi:hypothetical protein